MYIGELESRLLLQALHIILRELLVLGKQVNAISSSGLANHVTADGSHVTTARTDVKECVPEFQSECLKAHGIHMWSRYVEPKCGKPQRSVHVGLIAQILRDERSSRYGAQGSFHFRGMQGAASPQACNQL